MSEPGKPDIPPSVNTLGNHFLYDPENLPDRNQVTGPGTERPCGFLINELCKFIWTVKSWNCTALAIMPVELFAVFLAAGGASGTLVGALTGTAAATTIGGGLSVLTGRTKIAAVSTGKIRRTPPGVNQGVLQSDYKPLIGKNRKDPDDKKPLALDEDVDPRILKSFRNDINEGSVAIGPYHKLIGSNGSVFIDFSDIVYSKGQYWPLIVIMFGPMSGIGPVFSSAISFYSEEFRAFNLFAGFNVTVLGGITFEGGNRIEMFGSSAWFPGSGLLAILYGNIQIDRTTTGDGYLKRPCDRLYWDGWKDKDRVNYNEKDCIDLENNGVGGVIQKTSTYGLPSSSSSSS
jgi:hypothetical protein